MLAFLIVEAEPGANAGLGLGNRRIGVEVDFLIYQASSQPLDENVVHVADLGVHADHDTVLLEGAGEVVAGELAALIGIEDFWRTIALERFLERLDTEIGAERVGQPPRQHRTATQSMITTKYRKPLAIGM